MENTRFDERMCGIVQFGNDPGCGIFFKKNIDLMKDFFQLYHFVLNVSSC